MSLAALLMAPPAIFIHAVTAMGAFVLGMNQLLSRKGTRSHRVVGWLWVTMMVAVAVSSFWIHTLCSYRSFSIIHVLSVVTLLSLPLAVVHARAHRVAAHRRVMLILFFGALTVAGLFTFWPGRIMHDVVFGTAEAHSACS
jgi:uncharacterized membrane protein